MKVTLQIHVPDPTEHEGVMKPMGLMMPSGEVLEFSLNRYNSAYIDIHHSGSRVAMLDRDEFLKLGRVFL